MAPRRKVNNGLGKFSLILQNLLDFILSKILPFQLSCQVVGTRGAAILQVFNLHDANEIRRSYRSATANCGVVSLMQSVTNRCVILPCFSWWGQRGRAGSALRLRRGLSPSNFRPRVGWEQGHTGGEQGHTGREQGHTGWEHLEGM